MSEATGLDGVRRIFGLAHFAEATSGPIYLWVGVSKESVLSVVDRQFAWTLSITLALLVLAFATLWVGGERMLLRPISALAEAARKLGRMAPVIPMAGGRRRLREALQGGPVRIPA